MLLLRFGFTDFFFLSFFVKLGVNVLSQQACYNLRLIYKFFLGFLAVTYPS